jgi:hypothetical protein
LWLGLSASEEASRRVGMKVRVQSMEGVIAYRETREEKGETKDRGGGQTGVRGRPYTYVFRTADFWVEYLP